MVEMIVWDLLVFFGQNPSTKANARGIARRIGRQTQAVEKELDDLVYLGILKAHANGKGLRYRLAPVAGTQRAVTRFARFLIEAGWLAAVVVVPLFFNVYSSRVFEPDKLTTLRSIAL